MFENSIGLGGEYLNNEKENRPNFLEISAQEKLEQFLDPFIKRIVDSIIKPHLVSEVELISKLSKFMDTNFKELYFTIDFVSNLFFLTKYNSSLIEFYLGIKRKGNHDKFSIFQVFMSIMEKNVMPYILKKQIFFERNGFFEKLFTIMKPIGVIWNFLYFFGLTRHYSLWMKIANITYERQVNINVSLFIDKPDFYKQIFKCHVIDILVD